MQTSNVVDLFWILFVKWISHTELCSRSKLGALTKLHFFIDGVHWQSYVSILTVVHMWNSRIHVAKKKQLRVRAHAVVMLKCICRLIGKAGMRHTRAGAARLQRVACVTRAVVWSDCIGADLRTRVETRTFVDICEQYSISLLGPPFIGIWYTYIFYATLLTQCIADRADTVLEQQIRDNSEQSNMQSNASFSLTFSKLI